MRYYARSIAKGGWWVGHEEVYSNRADAVKRAHRMWVILTWKEVETKDIVVDAEDDHGHIRRIWENGKTIIDE